MDWAPSDKAWQEVSVGSEECPGANRCPAGQECFAENARAKAALADIVVVNTFLYGLDVGSDGAILPDHDVVIFDEAHQLEDVMSDTVGVSIGPGRFTRVAQALRRVLEDPQVVGAVSVMRVGGSIVRLCGLCPGCPPGPRPVDGLLGREPGGSDDGGLFEFDEFCATRPSSSATRARNRAFSDSSSASRASSFAKRSLLKVLSHALWSYFWHLVMMCNRCFERPKTKTAAMSHSTIASMLPRTMDMIFDTCITNERRCKMLFCVCA